MKQENPKEGYTRYIVVINNQEFFADYNPKSYGGTTHIEFQAKNDEEKIPISETGYLSSFQLHGLQKGRVHCKNWRNKFILIKKQNEM